MNSLSRPVILTAAFAVLMINAISVALGQANTAPSGLALEVIVRKGWTPSYVPVQPRDAKPRPHGATYSGFGRLPSWGPPGGPATVSAVNVDSALEGDGARARISVWMGKFHEREEQVASYLLHENESVIVEELTKYGVEPFEVKLVRVTPSFNPLPSFVSKAPSIHVIDIQRRNSTFPSYNLTLQNQSGRSVIALEIHVLVGGVKESFAVPRNDGDEPLIEPGALYQTPIQGAQEAQKTGDGYAPISPPDQSIVVGAALFAGGSFEGEDAPAADALAVSLARRTQLAKVIALLQSASEATGSDAPAALEQLRTQVAALPDEPDKEVAEQLKKDFPKLDQREQMYVQSLTISGRHGVKRSALDEITAFQKSHGQTFDAQSLKAWLSAAKENYEKWRARL